MTNLSRNRQARRARRDKSVLDHLTSGSLKPDLDEKHPDAREYDADEGGMLDRAIRKPDF